MDSKYKTSISNKKIKPKLHLYHTLNHSKLSKHAPKHCKILNLPNKDDHFGRIASRVKKIKKLEQICFLGYPSPKKYLILQLIKNQRRHIKVLPERSISLLRYFPNIANFQINMYSTKQLKGFLLSRNIKNLILLHQELLKKSPLVYPWLFWRHLRKLRSLKEMRISMPFTYNKSISEFMRKLDSSYVNIFSSLEYFRLDISFSKWPQVPEKTWDFPNIFNYVTDLRIKNDIHYFQNFFVPTIKQLANLTRLTLKLDNPKRPFIEYANLQVLGDLSKLSGLQLQLSLYSRSYLKAFLKNMTFPPSLKRIELQLHDIDWSPLLKSMVNEESIDQENPFESDQACFAFYEKWSQLASLEILDVEFLLRTESSVSSFYFLLPILKRLSQLTEVHYYNGYSKWGLKKKSLDLSKFLGAVSHLGQSLQMLKITDTKVSLNGLTPENIPALRLKVLNICGYIVGDSKVGILAKLFPKDNLQKFKSDEHILGLGKVMIQNNFTFLPFMRSLTKYSKMNMDVQICIDVRSLSMESLNTNLLSFIAEGIKIPNIVLKIVWASRKEINRGRLDWLLYRNQTFKSLEMETDAYEKFFHFINNKREDPARTDQIELDEPINNEHIYEIEEKESEDTRELLSEDDDFSDDYEYIDDGSVYCDFGYTDEEYMDAWSEIFEDNS